MLAMQNYRSPSPVAATMSNRDCPEQGGIHRHPCIWCEFLDFKDTVNNFIDAVWAEQ